MLMKLTPKERTQQQQRKKKNSKKLQWYLLNTLEIKGKCHKQSDVFVAEKKLIFMTTFDCIFFIQTSKIWDYS